MKNYPYNKEIKTISELKKYIGKPILFQYSFTKYESPRCQWIKQITNIGVESENNSISGCDIYGTNTLLTILDQKPNVKFNSIDDRFVPSISNAQEYARTLTQKEYEMYKTLTLKRLILGKQP